MKIIILWARSSKTLFIELLLYLFISPGSAWADTSLPLYFQNLYEHYLPFYSREKNLEFQYG